MKLHTTNVVADWLALTPRRVRQLRDEGVLIEKAPGLYDLQSSVVRYISYLRKGSGNTSTVSGMGVNGEIDSPILGQFESMEQEVQFNTLYSSAADMLNPLNAVKRK